MEHVSTNMTTAIKESLSKYGEIGHIRDEMWAAI